MEANNSLICIRRQGDVRSENRDGRFSLLLEAGAVAEFLVLQDFPAGSSVETFFDIHLAREASLDLVFLSLRGDSIRNRIVAELDGERARCRLGGLSLPDGTQQMDYDVRLSHRVSACSSSQLFKSIVAGRGTARFDGLIYVAASAQKTEAYQASHNLLSGDAARAHTRPQLEIYADDVKCSHGATVGRLNPDELFYMRTRGTPLKEAQLLQQMAFAGEVLEMISDAALRESLRSRVEKRLYEF